ncbi:MAG: HD domain-containing protein [Deltaproteobacteria bacterium]|nr:HD domain-containing protein [Deltaproteobacteria bacterium]
MNNRRYMAIPPAAVIPGVLPEFKIFVLTPQGQYLLWALEGNKVTSEQLSKLSEGGFNEIFVDLDDKFKYEDYLETNLGNILENKSSSDDQKAEIFSKISTNVVKDAFEKSLGLCTMGAAALQRTQKLIENALIFITESKSLYALAKMIGHDYQTYEHATKVLWLTVAFLGQNPEIMEQIEPGYQAFDEKQRMEILRQCGVGALLHDIGKALVSPEILNKNSQLTDVEWEIMKRHPLNGLAMLIDTDIPAFIKKAVLHHHEDFQGGGYPMSLEGLNITTLSRVLRITDVFDAMTSRRPYKEPMAPIKAARIMIGTPEDKKGDDCPVEDDRDQGMRRCFDNELLRKFVVFLGNAKLSG